MTASDAHLIALADECGASTISTNMAGETLIKFRIGELREFIQRSSPTLRIDFKQAAEQGGVAWYMLKASGEKLNPQHGEPSADAREWAEHCGMRIVILYAAPTFLGVADGDAVGGKSGEKL